MYFSGSGLRIWFKNWGTDNLVLTGPKDAEIRSHVIDLAEREMWLSEESQWKRRLVIPVSRTGYLFCEQVI